MPPRPTLAIRYEGQLGVRGAEPVDALRSFRASPLDPVIVRELEPGQARQ